MSSRKTVLETINDHSLTIYYLLKTKKIKIKDLYEAVLTRNKDIILEKIVPIKDKKLNSLKEKYTKEDCFDEILFLTENRYYHLKEIRNLVNIKEIIETVITDKIYSEKVKIHYTDIIIDLLVEDYYDHTSLNLFSKMKKKLIELDHNVNIKIIANIDKFYIQKITI
jgi:hypothetical protein